MKTIYYYLVAAAIFIFMTAEVDHFMGSPGGKTGSPGDNGATCTECHSGTATTQAGWITSNIPAEGYTPGETYNVTATGTHKGVQRFGFEATAENSAGSKTGTLSIINSNETKLANQNHSVTHKNTGTTPMGNSKSWSFNWTAPAAGTGDVTFYAAFNAANGNGNSTGDVIYKSSLAVVEAPLLPSLTIHLTGMTPHIGQMFEARLIDKYDMHEAERMQMDEIMSADFDIVFSAFEIGGNYWIDFYADFNDNGYYDGIPVDHAWRLTADNVSENTTMSFVHNTNFDEIHWKHMYSLEFSSMTPHIGQKLEVRLIDQETMMEAGRTTLDQVPSSEFTVMLPYIESNKNYYVDFYADLNGNGTYNAPPADHAWRMELLDTEGDEDDNFVHNTNFTDIGWNYRFMLDAMNMTPHLGQLFELRVVNQSTLEEAGRMRLDSIVLVDFAALTTGIMLNENYYIDFYADHNGNGMYDPPPTDHAWRLELSGVTGDSELEFIHNTNFTDIQWPTVGVSEEVYEPEIVIYPNPVISDVHIGMTSLGENLVTQIRVYSSAGTLQKVPEVKSFTGEYSIDLSQLDGGIYFIVFEFSNGTSVSRSIVHL